MSLRRRVRTNPAAHPPVPSRASIAVFWLLTATTLGSTRSGNFIDSGIVLLGRGNAGEALVQFEEAIHTDPADPEGSFFAGVALNELARWKDALNRLNEARKLGCRNPDLPFEIGWARIQGRQWDEAVAELTAYIAAHPGKRPQASLFLARAYLGKKQFTEAESALDEAVALAPNDADLKSEVAIERLRLAKARGDAEATARGVKAVAPLLAPAIDNAGRADAGKFDGTAVLLAPTLRPDLVLSDGPWLAPAPPVFSNKPWWVDLSLGGGYDNDARSVNPDVRAVAPPSRPAGFGEIRGDCGRVLSSNDDHRLWVAYGLFERAYVRRGIRADLLDQQASAVLEKQFGPFLRATVRVSDDYTLVDYSNFRNQIGAGSSLAWNVTPDLRTDLAYTYGHDHYLFQTQQIRFQTQQNRFVVENVLDRDAENHVLGLTGYWNVPHTRVQVRGGYFHTWNFAKGSSFGYEADAVFAGFALPLPFEITADLSYTYEVARYTNFTIVSDDLLRRRDPTDTVAVRLVRPLGASVSVYLQYDYNRDKSTVPFYSFNSSVVSAGATWRF